MIRPTVIRSPARILLFSAFVSVAIYILASALEYKVGFPLDDSWIHQTYARNLAQNHEWAFLPSRPSGGSTSPLWTLVLAVGQLFSRGIPYSATFFFGALALGLLAISGQQLIDHVIPTSDLKPHLPLFGLSLAFEWHMVWAAASGMETILMAALILWVFRSIAVQGGRTWLAGLAIGLSIWVRPDGITLLGPALFMLAWPDIDSSNRLRSVFYLLAGFAAVFVPYLLFNQLLDGRWWPNTFYAKHAEYQFLLQTPLINRLSSLITLPLIGPGLALLPGFLYSMFYSVRSRNRLICAAILWCLGYTLLYAMRLPLAYQHGRYLMPAMPVFFWLGWYGWHKLLGASKLRSSLKFGLNAIISLLIAAFYFIGAKTYADDVAIIETEMVAVSSWLNENLEGGVLLAVHDIGAIGYFTNFDFIDLAGLITPEIIPFMRDESNLKSYLDNQGVEYLVVFPDWYDQLVDGSEKKYCTDGDYARKQNHTNLCVYRWLTVH